jgi:hypothetical protein
MRPASGIQHLCVNPTIPHKSVHLSHFLEISFAIVQQMSMLGIVTPSTQGNMKQSPHRMFLSEDSPATHNHYGDADANEEHAHPPPRGDLFAEKEFTPQSAGSVA